MCMPIDELQRRAEEMEYSELLDKVTQLCIFLCLHAMPIPRALHAWQQGEAHAKWLLQNEVHAPVVQT